MSTETPNVDEARQGVLNHCSCDARRGFYCTIHQRVRDFEAAVRTEAIRERNEAIGLLRRAEWGGMDMSGGAGSDKHCPSCLNSKETGHWEGCAVAAFLARFPEGGEG